jgi:hypothetical protein
MFKRAKVAPVATKKRLYPGSAAQQQVVSSGMNVKAVYLTDDRDLPLDELRTLVIFSGGNGDWYVQVANRHGRATEGVRLCTSGGASTHAPGLTSAIATAYRAILAAQRGEPQPPSQLDLEEEVAAWRARFPQHHFEFGTIAPKPNEESEET